MKQCLLLFLIRADAAAAAPSLCKQALVPRWASFEPSRARRSCAEPFHRRCSLFRYTEFIAYACQTFPGFPIQNAVCRCSRKASAVAAKFIAVPYLLEASQCLVQNNRRNVTCLQNGSWFSRITQRFGLRDHLRLFTVEISNNSFFRRYGIEVQFRPIFLRGSNVSESSRRALP